MLGVRLMAATPTEILIERTFMPDAGPSAFAIGFPEGISFCYDPVRGGLNYAWTGGFIDLANVRPGPGKLIKAAALLGTVAYREKGPAPLRPGDRAHEPVWQFRGYHLGENAVEFRYTVDGGKVEETIQPLPGGRGLVRRFKVETQAGKPDWWYLPGASEGGTIVAPGGEAVDGGWRFSPGAAGEFTVEIRFGGIKP